MINKMMSNIIIRTVFLAGLIFFSVNVFAQKKRKVIQKQGIEGIVTWKAGNYMPSPDQPMPKNEGSPVVRELWVYELTNSAQIELNEGFYKKNTRRLVAKTTTDTLGRYKVRLPVGYYSVFSKEPKGLWANAFDDANNIQAVRVDKRKFTNLKIVIDYLASY
jgi:hypothetical protein